MATLFCKLVERAVAQSEEYQSIKLEVVGSIPTRSAPPFFRKGEVMKRKVVLYLTRDKDATYLELWDHCPEDQDGVFEERSDGSHLLDLCEREVRQVLGDTLKPGQCKPLEIRLLPLVKAKDLKP